MSPDDFARSKTRYNFIPVEVHFFVNCLDWEKFEELQADFTDQLVASAGLYGLRIFQSPAGTDIMSLNMT